jgi:hypothetical protein
VSLDGGRATRRVEDPSGDLEREPRHRMSNTSLAGAWPASTSAIASFTS